MEKDQSFYSSVAYFEYRLNDVAKVGGISYLDDPNRTVKDVTKQVNGGTNNLLDRQDNYTYLINLDILKGCFHFNQ